MQLSEMFVAEAIDQSLIVPTFGAMKKLIDQFVKDHYADFLDLMDKNDFLDEYQRLSDEEEEGGRDISEERMALVHTILDNASDLSRLTEDNPRYDQLVDELIGDMEVRLQTMAREYIEEKLGPIQNYDREKMRADFDSEAKKYLYNFTHIVVKIATDAKHRDNTTPKTSGGHFSKIASPGAYDTRWTRNNLVPRDDFLAGIQLNTSKAKIWSMITRRFSELFQEDYFGEYEPEQPVEKFLKAILPTYVHEVVHLEQAARADKTRTGKWHYTSGISYTPNPSKKRMARSVNANDTTRGSDRKNKRDSYDSTYRKFKPGRRGRPSHLANDQTTDAQEWDEYFGTAHEIEAHAAGAAASMVHEFLADRHNARWRWHNDEYSKREQQRMLNDFIDSKIDDLREGYYADDVHSLPWYISFRDKAKDIVKRAGESGKKLPKVDSLHRKVWRIFLKKLIRSLLAYKREVPKITYYDDEREPPKKLPLP